MTIPMAMAVPLALRGYEVGKKLVSDERKWVLEDMLGVNPVTGHFKSEKLVNFWLPIAAGAGISYAASKLGVNRKLARMGIPLIRI